MLLSPLLVETYFEIAERALDLAIFEPEKKPIIQSFRMDLGNKINPKPCPDKLILGALNHLLPNDSFIVSQPVLKKPFAFSQFNMRTKWRFNEGYKGNSTVRGWREYDSIYHAVFACMRGSGGYPLGKAYQVASNGLLLRQAIPSAEMWQVESTYGPRANFKISLRELPKNGNFRIRVKAAKYEDALLLERRTQPAEPSEGTVSFFSTGSVQKIIIPKAGIYQADIFHQKPFKGDSSVEVKKLDQGLIGRWELDGNAQSLPAQKKLEGQVLGKAKFVTPPFGMGKALDLDGKDDAVVVRRDQSMDVGVGEFTVSAWIRPTELRQGGIVCLGKYSWTHGWYFDMPNNRGVLRIETVNPSNQPNGTVQSRPGVIRKNAWQHVAAVVKRGKNETRLYLNGFQVGQGTIAPKALDNPKVDLYIGRIQDSKLFKGQIDGVRIYKRALEVQEIQALLEPGREAGLALNPPQQKPQEFTLSFNDREFRAMHQQPAFLAVRLPAGAVNVGAKAANGGSLHKIVLTPIVPESKLGERFERFEKRSAWLGVHLGLRRDCGSTFSPVNRPLEVKNTTLEEYVFQGAINNYPSDDVQENNDNYLAGVREIGVRSEYTDGRERPRLRLKSVEFEGPYYEKWPPETHQRIFIESPNKEEPEKYAREVIRNFATRAFRRPIKPEEENQLMSVWKSSYNENQDFTQSIKDTLAIVLTSPQFLFLIEKSDTPEAEPLNDHELASKLSYFLWNTKPDKSLAELAAEGKVRKNLDQEITRMISDQRFERFVKEFATQWLDLEKFDVVEMDRKRFPKLTRDTRIQLRQQPGELLKYLIRNNLPARNLITAEFILANEVTASYHNLGDRIETGFTFMPIRHEKKHLGGLLSQTSILAGLSDGREPNAIKRGAWLARKIIAEPPADPPPNVPGIEEIDPTLPLRDRLALHRNHKGCSGCHAGIDPWGIPMEQFDAGGQFNTTHKDSGARLPDSTEVADFSALQTYLTGPRIDRVVFSTLKHLATYATGRTLSYNELVFLEQNAVEKLREKGFLMQDVVRFVIKSDIFMKK